MPSLSVLRQHSQPESIPEETARPAANPTVFFAVTLFTVVIVGVLFTPLLFPIGILMIMAGRIWFALQILGQMSLPNAMMVLFVPFMPTVFLFKRFDIAWMPFSFGIAGFIVSIVGSASVSP